MDMLAKESHAQLDHTHEQRRRRDRRCIGHEEVVMPSASRYRSYLAKWKGLLDSQASWERDNPCLCPRTWSKH
ncbi:unnamed protein product, partial [Prunus brigantina]